MLPLPYQRRYREFIATPCLSQLAVQQCTLISATRALARRGPSCLITMNTIGGIDRASSYDFFKAAVAVDMICARNQPPLQGIATGIGECRFFFHRVSNVGVGGWVADDWVYYTGEDKQLTISLSNGEGSELVDTGGGEGSVEVA